MKFCWIAGLLIALTIAGCSAIPVQTEADPFANLRAYHTYRWMSRDRPSLLTNYDRERRELLDARVELGVDGYLATMGYQKSGMDTPDFLIGYQWAIGHAAADTLREFYRYRMSGGNKMLVEAYAIGYEQGVFILEIMDTGTRKIVWRAAAKAAVGRNDQPEKLDEIIAEMMRKLKQGDDQ